MVMQKKTLTKNVHSSFVKKKSHKNYLKAGFQNILGIINQTDVSY